MISAEEQVAVREWVKVPNIPGLYRNTGSGRYYGVKKIRGRRRERSLRTTDRKIAERRHREWISNLQRVDRECERATLRELLERFVAVNQGRAVKTQGTNDSIIRKMMKTWPDGIDIEVRQIRPSHLDEWLALHEQSSKLCISLCANLIHNGLKLFDGRHAADGLLRFLPSRCHLLERRLRNNSILHAHGTDIDFDARRIITFRHKTSTGFAIPIFSQVRPLVERLCVGKANTHRVFKFAMLRKLWLARVAAWGY